MGQAKQLKKMFDIMSIQTDFRQADLIRLIMQDFTCGKTKAFNLIKDYCRPTESKKDRSLIPALIDDKDFNINPPYTIYKIHEYWEGKNEKDIQKFIRTHINVVYELRAK